MGSPRKTLISQLFHTVHILIGKSPTFLSMLMRRKTPARFIVGSVRRGEANIFGRLKNWSQKNKAAVGGQQKTNSTFPINHHHWLGHVFSSRSSRIITSKGFRKKRKALHPAHKGLFLAPLPQWQPDSSPCCPCTSQRYSASHLW